MTKVKNPATDKRCKSIVAVKQDGSMMGCFDTIQIACDKYGLTPWLIRKACKTGSIYRGIRWLYEDDYHLLWLQGRTRTLAYSLPEWQKPLQRGDRPHKGASQGSLKTYCRSLIKTFGRSMTLDEIAVQLNI